MTFVVMSSFLSPPPPERTQHDDLYHDRRTDSHEDYCRKCTNYCLTAAISRIPCVIPRSIASSSLSARLAHAAHDYDITSFTEPRRGREEPFVIVTMIAARAPLLSAPALPGLGAHVAFASLASRPDTSPARINQRPRPTLMLLGVKVAGESCLFAFVVRCFCFPLPIFFCAFPLPCLDSLS